MKNNLSMAEALKVGVQAIGKDWKKLKRKADRDDRLTKRQIEQMQRPAKPLTIKDVAFSVMEAAYQKASGGGRYPANARQIYYAARPAILAHTGADKLESQYFTQTLLKDYLDYYGPEWDVVWDNRGHLTEPHTGRTIGLGGLAVRRYVSDFTVSEFDEFPEEQPVGRIDTSGPELRYGGVLFVEKEGFNEVLYAAGIPERYDMAIASTKGMPVSALCDLLGELRSKGVKVYVLHDFDKSGFSIVGTLHQGTRGSRGGGEIIDLGLRLEDIAGLEREPVTYKQVENPRWNLLENGATDEEVSILVSKRYYRSWEGERVELNAMTSDALVNWLEAKLEQHGVQKLIPEADTLSSAYRRAAYLQEVHRQTAAIRKSVKEEAISIPADLESRVRMVLEEDASACWDNAVWRIAQAAIPSARNERDRKHNVLSMLNRPVPPTDPKDYELWLAWQRWQQ